MKGGEIIPMQQISPVALQNPWRDLGRSDRTGDGSGSSGWGEGRLPGEWRWSHRNAVTS